MAGPVDSSLAGQMQSMVYHALWVGQLSLTPQGVAERPTWAPCGATWGSGPSPPRETVRISAQIALLGWRNALDGRRVALPVVGQVNEGLGGAVLVAGQASVAEITRRTGTPPYWACTVNLALTTADGRNWRLEVAPEASCAMASAAGSGELATLQLRGYVDGAPGPLLGTGTCRMSLRYFLHQLSGDPLS